jgi:hypothetical protein
MQTKRKVDVIDVDERPICKDIQGTEWGLWNATPDCNGRVISAPGGGVKCTKCQGWFCF